MDTVQIKPMDNGVARPPVYENKKIARRMIEEAWNKGQFSVVNELVAPNHISHATENLPNLMRGPEGVKQLVNMYPPRLSHLQETIEDQVVDSDKVVEHVGRSTEPTKGNSLGCLPATNV